MRQQRCPNCGSIPQHIGFDLAGNGIYHCLAQLTRMKRTRDGIIVHGMIPCDSGFQSIRGILKPIEVAYMEAEKETEDGEKKRTTDTVQFRTLIEIT